MSFSVVDSWRNQRAARLNMAWMVLQPEPPRQAAFSADLVVGEALTDAVVNGTVPGSVVTTTAPGVTIDNSVFPAAATGTPTTAGSYTLTETTVSGTVFVSLVVVSAPSLPNVVFSKTLYDGVATSGTIEGVPVDATAATAVPGITLVQTGRPVTFSGTPSGGAATIANGITLTRSGQTKNISVEVKPGVPVNLTIPTVPGTPQIGVPYGTDKSPGSATGPDDGTWTNSPTSRSVQWIIESGVGTGIEVIVGTSAGGANPIWTIPAGNEGKRLKRRVRVHNPAGSSTAPGTKSNWSAPIAAAAAAGPTVTTPLSLSSRFATRDGLPSGLGDVITVTPSVFANATGTPTLQFFADGLPIPGETGKTYDANDDVSALAGYSYQRTMETLTAVITCQETAQDSNGVEVVAYSSNSIAGNAGYKTWLKALFNPQEPISTTTGTQSITSRPTSDVLCIAGTHTPIAERTGPLKFTTFRRGWVIGQNMGGNQLGTFDMQWCGIEGNLFDGTGKPESDSNAFSGGANHPRSDLTMLGPRAVGGWGTGNAYKYQGQENKAAITSFQRVGSNEWLLTLAAPFPEPVTPGTPGATTVVSGKTRKIRIAGVPGYGPLEGPHFDYISIQIVDATHWRLALTDFAEQYFPEFPRMAIGQTVTGGTAYFMWHQAGAPNFADSAEHADVGIGQDQGATETGNLIVERATGVSAYQIGILGQTGAGVGPEVQLIDVNFSHDVSRDPQEINTVLLYFYTLKRLVMKNAWFKARFNRSVRQSSFFWSGTGKNNWTETVVAGETRVTNANAEMVGHAKDGVPEVDFAPARGPAYVSPGFLGYTASSALFTTFTLAATTVARASAGAVLTTLVGDYNGPEIIDVTFSGVAATIIKPGFGLEVLQGSAAVPGTYNFTATFTVRGKGITHTESLTITLT